MTNPITIKNFVKGELMKRRGMTLGTWGESKGFSKSTVRVYLMRFAGTKRRPPEGTISLEVISELEAETGIKICG